MSLESFEQRVERLQAVAKAFRSFVDACNHLPCEDAKSIRDELRPEFDGIGDSEPTGSETNGTRSPRVTGPLSETVDESQDIRIEAVAAVLDRSERPVSIVQIMSKLPARFGEGKTRREFYNSVESCLRSGARQRRPRFIKSSEGWSPNREKN